MALQKLLFRPGIVKDSTRYSGEGNWFDCDKVRFVNGLPQKIGGWVKINANAFSGVCRSLFNFSNLAGRDFLSLGTSSKLLIEEGSGINDITPLRLSNITLGSNPLKTGSASSGEITVTHTGHGAEVNDTVIITGATAVDGVSAGQINISHVITEVADANTYKIVTAGSASSGIQRGVALLLLCLTRLTLEPLKLHLMAWDLALDFGAALGLGLRPPLWLLV